MMTGSERKQLAKGLAFLSPWLIGFLVFTLTPIVLAVYYSFCDYELISGPPVPRGGKNFRTLADDRYFWLSLKNTGYYALLAIPSGLLVSLGLALMLNAKVRGQTVYRTIIFLPSLIPSVAAAMIWLWCLNPQSGIVNLFLGKLGIAEPPGWLTSPAWAMPSLALMSLWGAGHTVVIYLAGLQDVPAELYEAAEIDGAGRWRRLWHVTLPMLSPVIFFNLIMSLIGTLQVFDRPLIMTQGGPNLATYTFTYYLYDNAFKYLKMGYASAMALIQLLIILALTGLAFWTSRKWVHYQGK
jgi:multiple sugar transport system permease protein